MTKLKSTCNSNNLPDKLNHWEFQALPKGEPDCQSRLYRKYLFQSFESVMDFMHRASRLYISAQNHHPCWQNTYVTLEIWLTTHDANNTVTEKDIQLAKDFETLWLADYSEH